MIPAIRSSTLQMLPAGATLVIPTQIEPTEKPVLLTALGAGSVVIRLVDTHVELHNPTNHPAPFFFCIVNMAASLPLWLATAVRIQLEISARFGGLK